jgi:cytochrome c-type biogenesis protein CcmH
MRRLRSAMFGAAMFACVAGVARGQSTSAPRGAAPAAAQLADSALEARTSAVASQLRCPVCQGLSIQDSPAELAQQMRLLVHDQLAEGKTPEEVKAYFVSKYGEWILLAPKASGFNLLAYGLPVLVVLGGGIGIVLAVRRWTAAADAGPTESPGPDAINATEDVGR